MKSGLVEIDRYSTFSRVLKLCDDNAGKNSWMCLQQGGWAGGRWAKYFEISSGSFGSSCNTRYVTDWKATSFELWAETINQAGQAAIASPCLLPPYSCTLAFLPLNSTHPPMQSPVQQNQKLPEERRRCAPINETWSNLIWTSISIN